MDVARYLQRIGYSGPRHTSTETLHALQQAHLFTVPFENLSIHLGERIRLDSGWLFEKIVLRGRGGFCYELNGLFAELLEALGFRVTRLSARVYSGQTNQFGQEFDHLTLRVDLDRPWLVDVGFGRAFVKPLRLDDDGEQLQEPERYRITEEDGERVYWRFEDSWLPQYRFSNASYGLSAFEGMCVYHQTSPQSSFTARWMATIAHARGRETLVQESSDFRLISINARGRQERIITGFENAEILLEELFGLKDLGRPAAGRKKRTPKGGRQG